MKFWTHGLIVTLLAVLCGACTQPIIVSEPVSCQGAFEATVYQGPSAGLSLRGDLTTTIDPLGRITAILATEDGAEIQATGQANGQAINLVFFVNEDQRVYGVGTGVNDIRACSGEIGGPLVGPQPGDSGDWALIRVKIVPPPNRG